MLSLGLKAQVTWVDGKPKYREVFVASDDFEADYLDQLEAALAEATPGSSLILQLYNDLGYYSHTRNLTKALEFVDAGLAAAREAENSYWEGRLLVSRGAVLLRMEELDQAEDDLRAAIALIPEAEAWLLYTNLGYVYERRGMLGEAFAYAGKTLEIGKEYEDQKAKAMAYSDMSNLFWKQGKFSAALDYGLESLAIFEERGLDDLDRDFTMHLVGQFLVDLNRPEEALKYFEQSVILGERYGFYNNLSDTYIALSNLQTGLGNYQEAKEAGQEALRYAELLDNEFMIMRSYLTLGKTSNASGDHVQAAEYLQTSIDEATANFGDKFYLSLVYEELSRAFEGARDFEVALAAAKKANQLSGEVFTAEAEERVAKLQTEMEVAQKESTISIQQAELSRQRILQGLFLSSALVLIFILFLVYRGFLRKKKYSELLEKRNREKEFLLKEIHHRVKNNLETISSLLTLQIAKTPDPSMQKIMEETYTRVQSMGMIHLQLYREDNLKQVEMKEFFESLGSFILDTFDAADRILCAAKMEPIELDVDLAIPIGLIVNELISNSLKYAFPNGKSGNIFITLSEKSGKLLLEVSDDGVGISPGAPAQGTGFGSELIGLLTRQLDGQMSLVQSGGTHFSFEFTLNKAA